MYPSAVLFRNLKGGGIDHPDCMLEVILEFVLCFAKGRIFTNLDGKI